MARKAVQRLIPITASQDGGVPDAIHLLSTGHWHTPWHGAFEHTSTDLAEMVEHFDGAVALLLNKATKKPEAPVNYGHARGDKASGWITELYLDNDGSELWGKVTWTKEGARALREGEYKYISPEWHPRDFPWENPEEEGVFVDNVFLGAALTNIPLFKKLAPVMASTDAGGSDNQKKPKGGDMTLKLEEVRVKKLDELTDEEKSFLSEHQADLTDDERAAFEIESQEDAEAKAEQAAKDKTDAEAAEAEKAKAEALQASTELKGAQAQIAALEASLKATQDELLRGKLQASIEQHVERGAIKADQSDEAVELLMASSESQRTRLESFLSNLPSNELVTKGEIGDGQGLEGSAIEQLREKTNAILKASTEAGKAMSHADAVSQARRENQDLAKQADEESKG